MKGCELCDRTARMYCESDQASLCWRCDAKVHSANFLVARHTRSLLCRTCQEPTPWRAAGARLSPTVSICQKCVSKPGDRSASDVEVDSGERSISERDDVQVCDDDDDDDNDDLEEAEEEEEEEDEEEEGEGVNEEEDADNQVVPLTTSVSGPAASPSSEEETSSLNRTQGHTGSETLLGISLKRRRENEDLLEQVSIRRSASLASSTVADEEAPSRATCRQPKQFRPCGSVVDSRKDLILNVNRCPTNERENGVNTVVDVCNLINNRLFSADLVSDASLPILKKRRR